VAANKQDKEGAMSLDILKKDLDLSDDTLILPCNATDKKSAETVLNALIERL